MAASSCILAAELGIVLSPEIIHPEFSTPPRRRSSFSDWPIDVRLDSQELAQAGFFYTGTGDNVTCFSCNGSLKNWLSTDIPIYKHKLWFPTCQIPQLMDRNAWRGPSCQQEVCSGIFQVQDASDSGPGTLCFLQGARPIELDLGNISPMAVLALDCIPVQQAFQGFYTAKGGYSGLSAELLSQYLPDGNIEDRIACLGRGLATVSAKRARWQRRVFY